MISTNNMDIKGMDKLYAMDSSFRWDNVIYIDSINYNISIDEYYDTFSLLQLGLVYEKDSNTYVIIVEFYDVINLCLNRIGGKYIQIFGFEIIDKSTDGWENSQRYLINDYEDNIINFSCKDIKVLSVDKKNLYY